ncbi:MAG: TIGR01777 family oxidoreductase [Cytophaga sp.]|uniref:TIGR01777 family oxidoreductase n=1 Tax=Cytophaga sp. TaxID=29535 RepID=UPI003F7FE793
MKKKIVLAGGSGFIGTYLEKYFTHADYEVIIVSRQPGSVQWTNQDALIEALEGAEMLINLAGKSVDCRYNDKNKAEILRSRVETTTTLGNCIGKCKHKPKLWINSSTATIYRHAEDRPMTEATGEIGSGFSVGIATQWEAAFFHFNYAECRQVALRIAIVLGEDGGVMSPLKNLVRFGLGGKQGSGNQRFSWLHIEDLKNIICYIQAHEDMYGIYNCSSPNPSTNKILMQELRKAMHVPFGLPTPKWLLKIGAVLIRTEIELVLKSRWVLPEKLLAHGFRFMHTNLGESLKDFVKKN